MYDTVNPTKKMYCYHHSGYVWVTPEWLKVAGDFLGCCMNWKDYSRQAWVDEDDSIVDYTGELMCDHCEAETSTFSTMCPGCYIKKCKEMGDEVENRYHEIHPEYCAMSQTDPAETKVETASVGTVTLSGM